jgi:hypothetical protein
MKYKNVKLMWTRNKTLDLDLDLIIDLNPIFNQTIALELQIMKIIIL